MELKENEIIDDLELNGLKIIQNKEGFKFGIDSVLLSDFAKELKSESIVADLGTGTGIIAVLLSAKTKAKKIIGIEIQKEVADMANRTIKMNKLEDKIEILNENIKSINNIFDNGYFDVIVTNPPYKKINTGKINNNDKKIISRHEVTASLEDFICTSSKILKDKGEFYMVHRPDRLVDIMEILRKYKMEPKKIRFVHPKVNKSPNLILIKAVKNARQFLIVDNPLYVYNEDNTYTHEIMEIYNKM